MQQEVCDQYSTKVMATDPAKRLCRVETVGIGVKRSGSFSDGKVN